MGRKAVSYLLYCLAVVFTGLLFAAAVVCYRASFVVPEEGQFWAIAGLLMPVVLVANLGAMVWWLWRRKWLVSLIPVAAVALNIGYISAMIQLPDFGDGDDRYDVRIATLNIHGFRQLDNRAFTAHTLAELAARERLDVLCLQEFHDDHIVTGDSIATYFGRQMPYFVREKGQAILSRYPILDHDHVVFADTNNDYLWVDLLIGSDTVRIFSLHLQTSGISALQSRFQKGNSEIPVDVMVGELERNSRLRAAQVHEIRAAVDASPYPIIVLGDFNDTPSSYTYRRMKNGLRDGFRASGSGYGGTFRSMGGVLRIDYIFYDDFFRCIRYYMPQDDGVSDHRMVVADLRFEP